MTSYILKNIDESKDILMYQEKECYNFTPSAKYKWVKKITVLDSDLVNAIWENKLEKEYSKALKNIYALLANTSDDEGASLDIFEEIEKIKQYFMSFSSKKVDKKIVNKYLKKILTLENNLKVVSKRKNEVGKGR